MILFSSITGAVDFPGTYTLNQIATIEDLYQLVGNFKNQAYLKGIYLTREVKRKTVKSIKNQKKILNKAFY